MRRDRCRTCGGEHCDSQARFSYRAGGIGPGRVFLNAGVPKGLCSCPLPGATGGAHLVASDAVDVVILTGSTDTPRMLDARPRMNPG